MRPTILRQASRALQRGKSDPGRHSKKKGSQESEPGNAHYLRSQEHLDLFDECDESQQQGRGNLVRRVQKAITDEFGTAFKVSTFGSCRYGASSSKSDLDLIALDRTRPQGFDPENKQKFSKIYRINILAGTLKHAGFHKVQKIPATVPIVRFKDKKTGIQCDLNVNDQPGYWNTLLIQRYISICPHLRSLLIVLKHWARPLGLNNPSPEKAKEKVTYSSYALALMTIAFLQQRRFLPNLQENLSPDLKEHIFWNRKPVFVCDLRFNWTAEPPVDSSDMSTTDLLIEWFEFWGNFNPSQQMADIRLGGILPRLDEALDPSTLPEKSEKAPDLDVKYNVEALKRWESQTFCLIDPFIRVKNVGQNISGFVFEWFQEECRKAEADLRTRKLDLGNLGDDFFII